MKNKLVPILFWIIVWQLISMIIKQEILIVSPFSVLQTMAELIPTKEFWDTILFSFSRIFLGFISSVITGIVLAYFSYKSKTIRYLLSPLMTIIKATPVVSFIILALVWMSSKNLSILISFLMVLPMIYTSVLEGASTVDNKMIEMTKVYSVPWNKKFLHVYLPTIMPFFISACSVGLGFCWKSGIAAEVIGFPTGSIGEKLYIAKMFLNTGEIFAWTLVIILISILFEKAFIKTVKLFVK